LVIDADVVSAPYSIIFGLFDTIDDEYD